MKPNNFKTTILLLLSILTFSCSKSDEKSSAATSFAYQGNWSGTFTGTNDRGSWTANVNSSGIATGTATSTAFSNTYQLDGTVTMQGIFVATFGSASTGARFNGQMNSNGSASGILVNSSLGWNGNWTGTR